MKAPTEQQIRGAVTIRYYSEETKCDYCRHRFSEPLLRPVPEERRPSKNGGRISINPSPEWLAHIFDTHGYPPDIYMGWICQRIYKPQEAWKIVDEFSTAFEKTFRNMGVI